MTDKSKTWPYFFTVLLMLLPLCLIQVTKNSAYERIEKLSNLGGYHRLALFVTWKMKKEAD
jgi:hypothetical protein